MDQEKYERWFRSGGDMLIQDALPELSPDDREFMISGTSPNGWKQLFGESDE